MPKRRSIRAVDKAIVRYLMGKLVVTPELVGRGRVDVVRVANCIKPKTDKFSF